MKYHCKEERLSNFFVILIFPGFFIYNYFLSLKMMVSIPYMTIIPLLYLFFFILIKFRKNKIKFYFFEYIFLIVILYNLAVMLINFIFNDKLKINIFIWNAQQIIQLICLYILGKYIYLSKKIDMVLFLCSALIITIFIFNYNIKGYLHLSFSGEGVSNYMSLGNVIYITFLMSYCSLQNSKIKILFFLLSSLILLLLGARSELLVYVFCIAFVYVIQAKAYIKILLSIFILLFLFLFINNLDSIVKFIPESRMSDLLINREKSTSIIARENLLNNGINSILQSPILGDYGSYTLLYGHGVGSYVHNMLSAWVNLGLLGFIIYLFLLLFLIKGIIDFKNTSSNIGKFYLSLTVATILMLVFSKQYLYMHLGFCIGLLANINKIDSSVK